VYAVAKVDDQLTLAQTSPAAYPPSSMYVVKAGDTIAATGTAQIQPGQ